LYNFPILANLASRFTLEVFTSNSKGTTVTRSRMNQLVRYSCTISYIRSIIWKGMCLPCDYRWFPCRHRNSGWKSWVWYRAQRNHSWTNLWRMLHVNHRPSWKLTDMAIKCKR
jgi:hypothetical protein